MRSPRRQFLRLAAGAAALSIAPWSARAQAYPARPIKLVVPFGPGGPTDVFARVTAEIVRSALGQVVVVENRPGAGGAIATKAIAAAAPDGYTLLFANNATLCVIPALVENPGYDPLKSFAAVAKIADSTPVMVTPASFPARSVEDFVAQARAHPGKLSYASAGTGNLTQLLAEVFKARTGTDVVHVPYKSGAEMVTAILGQQVHMAFADVSIVIPLVREGKLKALGMSSARRHPKLPEVPTMVESGVADFIFPFWAGVVAPAGTPADVIGRINAATQDGLRSPQVLETLGKIGAQADPGSARAFADFIAVETRRWSTVARTAGLSAQ
jgi:tripartite-type tricarboxylate transporter receptor subunit TctC